MVQAKSQNGMLENLFLAAFLVSTAVSGYGLIFDKSAISFAGSIGVCGTAYAWKKSNETEELSNAQTSLKTAQSDLASALNDKSYTEAQLTRLQADFEAVQKQLAELERIRSEWQVLKGIQAKYEALEAEYKKLDAEQTQDNLDLEALRIQHESLRGKLNEALAGCESLKQEFERVSADNANLQQENNQFKARFEAVDELAKLRADSEASQLRDAIGKLQAEYESKMKEYLHVANLYNSLRQEDDAVLKELNQKFAFLSGEGFQEVEQTFSAELSDRDRMLLAASAKISELEKPHYFDEIGEFVRPNRLIKALWESENQICLDASEIVPFSDNTGFEVYFSLRDRRIRGQATIDALNQQGNEFSVLCGCIKDLKFEYDRINPHRIKTSMIFRKAQKTKDSVSALWKTADQFSSIAGKWARIRITGGSESGKSPLAEMIAGAIQQHKPDAQIVLAFPKDGSEKNHWSIPVSYSGWKGCLDAANETHAFMDARDKGENQSKFFYAPIIDESDTSLSKYPEMADAIKAILKSGSHNNVGVIVCGQNANVKQWKGFDRSDFENCVNVHIGSNAYHAIENSNLSQAEKNKLKETADKIIAYCESVNSDIADEDIKTRFALVLEPNKKGYFIELPRFGSVVYDNFKASKVEQNEPIKPESKVALLCPQCGSENIVKKGFYDKAKTVRRLNCKSCNHTFKSDL